MDDDRPIGQTGPTWSAADLEFLAEIDRRKEMALSLCTLSVRDLDPDLKLRYLTDVLVSYPKIWAAIEKEVRTAENKAEAQRRAPGPKPKTSLKSGKLQSLARAFQDYKNAERGREEKSRMALMPGFRKQLSVQFDWLKGFSDNTIETRIIDGERLLRQRPLRRRYIRALRNSPSIFANGAVRREIKRAMRLNLADDALQALIEDQKLCNAIGWRVLLATFSKN